ncbi:MAG: hypothetical protein ATN35_13410 [Epulopiscium sp. Nele67-Bin004]|nr:MAG: hypothetical protein ATN35_13410 [Epulopiscium sp. Nele67-Bin004]
MFVFNHTVVGNKREDKICQDYSDIYVDNSFYIGAIADGHGSKTCIRSDIGAKLVVECAIECFRQFATTFLAENITLNIPTTRHCRNIIQNLTNCIVASWYDAINRHYATDPIKGLPAECVPHLYGTTFMGALVVGDYLILLQQGDGRCVVFFENGDISQPIPWDRRCEYNSTTSMCDADVTTSIRHAIIKREDVVACFLGCDGVEDAYIDTYHDINNDTIKNHCIMGGVNVFYKHLLVKIFEEQTNFNNYFRHMLADFAISGLFSKTGSGDDVSVVGFVEKGKVFNNIQSYKKDVELYELEELFYWKNDDIRSKKRKLEVLEKRLETAKSDLNIVKLDVLKKRKSGLLKYRENFYIDVLQASKNKQQAQQTFDNYKSQYFDLEQQCEKLQQKIRNYE